MRVKWEGGKPNNHMDNWLCGFCGARPAGNGMSVSRSLGKPDTYHCIFCGEELEFPGTVVYNTQGGGSPVTASKTVVPKFSTDLYPAPRTDRPPVDQPVPDTFIKIRVDGGPLVTIECPTTLTLDDVVEDLVIPALYALGYVGVREYFDPEYHADSVDGADGVNDADDADLSTDPYTAGVH